MLFESLWILDPMVSEYCQAARRSPGEIGLCRRCRYQRVYPVAESAKLHGYHAFPQTE
jgi:hypothetical protein